MGASWGGTLVANYMASYPQHVAKAIFTSPATINEGEWSDEGQIDSRLSAAAQQQYHNTLYTPRFITWYLLGLINPKAAHTLVSDREADAFFNTFVQGISQGTVCDPPHLPKGQVQGYGFYDNIFTTTDAQHRHGNVNPRTLLASNHTPTLLLTGACNFIKWAVTWQYKTTLPTRPCCISRMRAMRSIWTNLTSTWPPSAPFCLGHPCRQYISFKDKRGKEKTRKLRSGTLPESLTTRSFLMYRLRHLDVDDKVCEQVEMTLLAQVYPKEAIERCVGQSQPWASKARRVRQSTLLALVLFVIGMALWSRLNQRLVWDKLVGKLSALHPGEPQSQLNASALSGRRPELGSQGLQALLHECCRVLAQPQTMPSAFFGRYRLMAIDGTVFNTADTVAHEAAFGRSSNQYGKGAYPQVRCVLLAECGSHAVVELEIDRYAVSEVHGAHRLLDELGRDTLVLVDAGIISGGFLEHARQRRVQVLGALEAA